MSRNDRFFGDLWKPPAILQRGLGFGHIFGRHWFRTGCTDGNFLPPEFFVEATTCGVKCRASPYKKAGWLGGIWRTSCRFSYCAWTREISVYGDCVSAGVALAASTSYVLWNVLWPVFRQIIRLKSVGKISAERRRSPSQRHAGRRLQTIEHPNAKSGEFRDLWSSLHKIASREPFIWNKMETFPWLCIKAT